MSNLNLAESGPTQGPAGPGARNGAVGNDPYSIHEYMFHTDRIVFGVLECGKVVNRRRIEDGDVRHHSRPQDTAIVQMDARRRF